jgi:hypothetical protein
MLGTSCLCLRLTKLYFYDHKLATFLYYIQCYTQRFKVAQAKNCKASYDEVTPVLGNFDDLFQIDIISNNHSTCLNTDFINLPYIVVVSQFAWLA